MSAIYSKLQSIFHHNPIDLENLFLNLISQNQFYLSHYMIDLLSIKPGIFHACNFMLEKIFTNETSPIVLAFFDGDFSHVNSFFIQATKLIDSYQPDLYTPVENKQMQIVTREIFRNRSLFQEATGFSFNNFPILVARRAALEDENALELYNSKLNNVQDFTHHLLVGSFEAEKNKWDFSNQENAIAHLKKAFFLVANQPGFSQQFIYEIDWLNIIFDQLIPHIRNKKIKFEQVKDCFECLINLYETSHYSNIDSSYMDYFKTIEARSNSSLDSQTWLSEKIASLELISQTSGNSIEPLNEAYSYAVELTRRNDAYAEKMLKLLAAIFELQGVVSE